MFHLVDMLKALINIVNNRELENVESIKDQGVTFDSHLKFDLHINEKIYKPRRILGIIR